MLDQAGSWLQTTLGISRETENHIVYTLAVVLALWAIQRIVLGLVWRRTHNIRLRYRWQKATTYVTTPIGLLLVARIWFPGGIGSLLTGVRSRRNPARADRRSRAGIPRRATTGADSASRGA